MRNSHRRAVATVAALTTLSTAALPAAAASAAAVPWTMAPCATAVLDETTLDTNGGWLVMNGTAVQCAPVAGDGGVRLAVYPAGAATGTAAGYNVRLFRSAEPGAVRSFGAAVAKPVTGDYGVCVLAGAEERITCVRLFVLRTQSPNRLSVTWQPLDPADPLVAKPVDAYTYTGSVFPPVNGDPTGGVCGTCF